MSRFFLILFFQQYVCMQLLAQYTVEEAWRDAQVAEFVKKSAEAQKRVSWFKEARMGMFIHWNPSSVVLGEISWSKQFYEDNGENLKENPRPTLSHAKMQEHTEWLDWFVPAVPGEIYDHLHKSFYPGMFDADSIISIAKHAGMKYIVMVAKHHDGFCMWNSQFTDFDMMCTPFKRDILGEIASACHRSGIKLGVYYSQRDWHHPDYSSGNIALYNQYMRNQIKEILTKYAPVSLLFFDAFEWKEPEIWETETMFKEIYSIAPEIIINDRCGIPADYSTPEQVIGDINMERTWESNMTFTGEWSWRGFINKVVSIEECFRYIVDCIGGNGNLLLNIDPLPTGQIDPREKSRLKIIGNWIVKNGEAIYGTIGGFLRPAKWGASTRKGNNLYLLVRDWDNFPDRFSDWGLKISSVSLLSGERLDFENNENGLSIEVSEELRDEYVTVIKITTTQDLSSVQILG